MLGNDVVVAPVLVQGAVSRDVYLPEGELVDPQRRKRSAWRLASRYAAAPLTVLPVFVRESSKVAGMVGTPR